MGLRISSHLVNGETDCGLWSNVNVSFFAFISFLLIPDLGFLGRALKGQRLWASLIYRRRCIGGRKKT